MKKFLLTLCAGFCLASAALAQSVAQKVAGSYAGTVYVSLGAPLDPSDLSSAMFSFDDQKIDIVAADTVSNTIDFTLYNFKFMTLELGDINLQDVGVKDSIENVTVFLPKDTVEMSFPVDSVTNIDASVSIDVTQSTITGAEASMMLNVVWHQQNGDDMPIYVAFVGKKTVDAGISAVPTTGAQAKGIYTLTGVRMPNTDTANLPKGIYIINGKKTIIK